TVPLGRTLRARCRRRLGRARIRGRGRQARRARPPHRRDPRNFREIVEGRVSHKGRYYAFDAVAIDPPLPAQPKLWVAGGGRTRTSLSPDPETIAPTVLERICRKADGWLSRASGSNRTVIEDWTTITRRLDEIGRARDSLVYGHLNFIHVVPTDD